MRLFIIALLGMIILLQSCTGQKPANLKNSSDRRSIKNSCSLIKFEGQVLSKTNILNIFDCSGWGKQYPSLNEAIKTADEIQLNEGLKVFNDSFLATKKKRKLFFQFISEAQSRGQLDTMANLLQESILNHDFPKQLDHILNSKTLNISHQEGLMKVLSVDNEFNLQFVRALRNLLKAYETQKIDILHILINQDKEKLVKRLREFFDDFAGNMSGKNWQQVAGVIYDRDSSPIQNWGTEGLTGNLRLLLNVIQQPGLSEDVGFLKKAIDEDVVCENSASTTDFQIDVGYELNHKIESLKHDSREVFADTLLHGLTKFLAFQEFCEEREKQQGLKAFFQVLQHASSVLPSLHDYRFLKRIHQVFGDDRFVFLSFLVSDSFISLRDQLHDLKTDGKDEDFVRALYGILAELESEDLKIISEFPSLLSQDKGKTKNWYEAWSSLWLSLDNKEKDDFIRFLGLFLEEESKGSLVLDSLESLMTSFPDFSSMLAKVLEEEKSQVQLKYIISLLAAPEIKDDLSLFLSKEGFFEFLSILTREATSGSKPVYSKPIVEGLSSSGSLYVEEPESESDFLKTQQCFAELSSEYLNDSSYYSIVNTLPEICLNVLGRVGFVGQIYIWMNSSHSYFQEHYQVDDFHAATGVWAPGMLQFIFSAAVKADLTVKGPEGREGILHNVDDIHRVFTHPSILEGFHRFSKLYSSLHETVNFDSRLLTFLESKTDDELNSLMANGFQLLKDQPPYLNLDIKSVSCKDISSELGVNPCLTPDELAVQIADLARILKRPNENNQTLMKEIVKWLHPGGGIDLPFGKKVERKHSTDLNEIIRFLYDLSSEKTSKEFSYRTPDSHFKVKGTTIDRLEVVIRDISFTNNFYGAYFKNQLASARNYREEVIKSRKLLKILSRSGGVLRGVRGIPEASKWGLSNVKETYWSLVEVSDMYSQPDGASKSYADFIQSLLTAITTSSKEASQAFNAYRIPKNGIPEGHNGIFLTKIVEMSGLRHLAQFVRSRFSEDLSALRTKEFKKINKNLIARHELTKLQEASQTLLEKYLDNDRNQMNLLIEDIVSFFKELSLEDQENLEEIALKMLSLLSDENLSTDHIQKLGAKIDLLVEMWPEIRLILTSVSNQKKLLTNLNALMDNLVKNPRSLDHIIGTLMQSNLLQEEEIKRMLARSDIQNELSALINIVIEADITSDLNWIQIFSHLFSSPDTEWESIKEWSRIGFTGGSNKLTLSLLISFLGEKDASGFKLKGIMDELFLNHRQMLEQFLSTSFHSLRFKPEHKNPHLE